MVKTGLESLYRFGSYHHATFKPARPVVSLSVYFFRVSGNQMRLLTPTLYRSQMAGARQSLSMDCTGEENQTGEWERTNRNQCTTLYTTFTSAQNPQNTLIFLISVYMWKKFSTWHKLKETEFLQQTLVLNLHICATRSCPDLWYLKIWILLDQIIQVWNIKGSSIF